MNCLFCKKELDSPSLDDKPYYDFYQKDSYGNFLVCHNHKSKVEFYIFASILDYVLIRGKTFNCKLMISSQKTHVWQHTQNGVEVFKTIFKFPFLLNIDPDKMDSKIKTWLILS